MPSIKVARRDSASIGWSSRTALSGTLTPCAPGIQLRILCEEYTTIQRLASLRWSGWNRFDCQKGVARGTNGRRSVRSAIVVERDGKFDASLHTDTDSIRKLLKLLLCSVLPAQFSLDIKLEWAPMRCLWTL